MKLQSQTLFPCNTKEEKHFTVCINKKHLDVSEITEMFNTIKIIAK